MPYRSTSTFSGRSMAGARSLWRATGMGDADFEKPIVAIAKPAQEWTFSEAKPDLDRAPKPENA